MTMKTRASDTYTILSNAGLKDRSLRPTVPSLRTNCLGAALLPSKEKARKEEKAEDVGAVVVVEAAAKGGALITARLALDQGIHVFAVPGDVDRESSLGCNLLIRDGAHPVLDPADLIEELQLVLGPARSPAAEQASDDPVLARIVASGQVSLDDLSEALDLPVGDLLARIGLLEALGSVRVEGSLVRANGH